MQAIKTRANELTALGKLLDHEDLIEKILEGLDDDYQPIIDAVNGHDTPISFDELYKKLINEELSLHQKNSSSPLSATANPTYTRSTLGNKKNHSTRPSWNSSSGPLVGSPSTNRDGRLTPRPFLDHC